MHIPRDIKELNKGIEELKEHTGNFVFNSKGVL